MAKNKLKKFAELESMDNVFEYPLQNILDGNHFHLRGKWNSDFFRNDNPIVLELGCGRGEYTVGLAKRFENVNYIGIDIKGARMWTGATESNREGLKNVAFVRTDIQHISSFFAENEVSEIWITFPDPQMKKTRKRLTSERFLNNYRKVLKDNGLIRLKTDSNFLLTYTTMLVEANKLPINAKITDIYQTILADKYSMLTEVKTYYESQWLGRGISIKYIEFALPKNLIIEEIECEIPYDDYRSYGRQRRSELKI